MNAMEIVRLLGILRPILDSTESRWMLAGGWAVVAWGSGRTTLDLDLVVDDTNRGAVLERLAAAGFQVLLDSEGFANLLHPDHELGRLDLIWVRQETSHRMFAAAVEQQGPDMLRLLVPSPEHLIAMKVKAVRSRPTRIFRDGEDLRILLSLPGIDENQCRASFERTGLLDLYERLKTPR